MPFLPPSQQRQSTEGKKSCHIIKWFSRHIKDMKFDRKQKLTTSQSVILRPEQTLRQIHTDRQTTRKNNASTPTYWMRRGTVNPRLFRNFQEVLKPRLSYSSINTYSTSGWWYSTRTTIWTIAASPANTEHSGLDASDAGSHTSSLPPSTHNNKQTTPSTMANVAGKHSQLDFARLI